MCLSVFQKGILRDFLLADTKGICSLLTEIFLDSKSNQRNNDGEQRSRDE